MPLIRPRERVVACLMLVMFAVAARPAAGAQAVAVDQSTPRGALKALTAALDGGDTAAMRALIVADTPEQQAWADAMIGFSAALSRLRTQATQTFGPEAARTIVGDTASATAAAMRQIDESTEELDGDRATVRSTDPQDRPLLLRRTAGGWVVPVTTITGDAGAGEFTPVTDRLRRQAAAVDSVIADVAAGKLTTPEQVAQAMQRRQFEARAQPEGGQPATQPSTQRSDS